METFYNETTNYETFDFFYDNRAITTQHVNKLADSFKNFGQLRPIVCSRNKNGKLKIVDGQHRYMAAKSLGRAVKYTIDNTLTSESVTEINTTQKKFTLQDWVSRFATQNIEDYKNLLYQFDYYKNNFSQSIIVTVFNKNGSSAKGILPAIRYGKYKIDERKGTFLLNSVLKCQAVSYNKEMAKTQFILALDRCFKNETFDLDRFLSKLRKNKINIFSTWKDTYTEIQRIYNHTNMLEKNRLL